jgi:hypothetical protein
VQRFHSDSKEYFSAGSSTASTAGEGLGNLSATLEKLKADLEMQREIVNELKYEEFRNRDNNNLFKPWRRPFPWPNSLDPHFENMGNLGYQNNNSSLDQGNSYPSNRNSARYQHGQMPSFPQGNEANTGPGLDPSTRNWGGSNRQSANVSHTGTRPHAYLHNEQQGNRRNSHDRNHQTPNPNDPLNMTKPSPKNQDHKPRGSYGEGLDPALAHQRTDPLNQLQQQQLYQHDRNRGPKGKQPYNRRQHKMGAQMQPSFSVYEPSMFRKKSRWQTPGRGKNRYRVKARAGNNRGTPCIT